MDIKVKTIHGTSAEDFDKKVLALIEKGFMNSGDLTVVRSHDPDGHKEPRFAFFQTYVWYPVEEGDGGQTTEID